jgi:tetratricopeptide (TPR) repeat protein
VSDAADAPASGPARIVLNLIVRDEARVIPRCLAAAAPVVDALCACDTGSTDDTPALVEAFARERGIPCAVPRHAWRDFGHNRTLALEEARSLVGRLGWDPRRTWILFLDADQTLEVGPDFRRTSLAADAYHLPQRNAGTAYWNVRLLRADRPARYVGATHEYLALPAGTRTERLPSLAVVDRNDGGARADKFDRDRRLLLAALERDPSDARALFYLARTYRSLGDPLRALSLFHRRVARGGWSEEVWHSWFAIAEIHEAAGDLEDARRALWHAIRVEPRRAEAFHRLARVHRRAGRSGKAAAAARHGLRLPFPEGLALFTDRAPYDHGLREELVASAAGTRHEAQGLAALDALLRSRAAPAEAKDRAHRVLPGYAEVLATDVRVPLAPALADPWVPCNPSIARRGEGYVVNVRCVNYRQSDARDWQVLDPERVVRTRNVLLDVDPALRAGRAREVVCDDPPLRTASIRGFEDVRLLATPRGLRAVATTADRHPTCRIGPSWLAIAEDGRVTAHRPLVGYGEGGVQKNWLPFLDETTGEPRLLYAQDPWVVLAVDEATGRCRAVEERRPAQDLSRWRGGAGPVPLATEEGPGRLWLVHEVAHLEDRRRRYLHRFVWTSADGERRRATAPFVFHHVGIEYAAGLCATPDGRDLLVTYGVEDREAWLARIPVARVAEGLLPVA